MALFGLKDEKTFFPNSDSSGSNTLAFLWHPFNLHPEAQVPPETGGGEGGGTRLLTRGWG